MSLRGIVLTSCLLMSGFVGEYSQAAANENAARYQSRDIVGWTVHVSEKLLQTEPEKTKVALELMQRQLEEIVRVVPAPAVRELRKVPLWVSPPYPDTQPKAEYHPGAGWLRENGRDPALVKSVEFSNVSIFEQETRRMPNFTLHELAHAYHDRVLTFEEPRVRAAFEAAVNDGLYTQVERKDAEGRISTQRHYALTNHKEYFAEASEAYFATNDFFPYNRPQLQEYDSRMCRVLEDVWGITPKRQNP